MKTRLQRFMADCGIASRRECEAMILSGRVRVNGMVRTLMPVLIEPGQDVVTVDEAEIGGKARSGATPDAAHAPKARGELIEQGKVYFLLNKPKGILVTNNDPSNRKTVTELMKGVKERLFPVGRLDMDSRGTLIMTNDGELANRLTHPRYGVEKVYIVEVDGRLSHDDLEKIKRGVWLGPSRHPLVARSARPKPPGAPSRTPKMATKTDSFHIKLVGRERGRTILEVRVKEAKNSEIRRVMAHIGHTVRDLNRVSIAEKITTKGLEVGEFRPLSPDEIRWLFRASSPEFHSQQRAATQAWYEAKEMEKERKRLETESANSAARPTPSPAPPAPLRKEFRERPVRKGKKPFVPPTGRNAGKPLGGNYIGKQRLEYQSLLETPPETSDTPPTQHPLGDHAQSDE